MNSKYYILVRDGQSPSLGIDYKVNTWQGINSGEKHFGLVAQTIEGWFDVFIQDPETLVPKPWLFNSPDEAEREIQKLVEATHKS